MYAVYIDDTGSGQPQAPVRYVGAVFTPYAAPDVPRIVTDFLSNLNVSVRSHELHFTDIFQGQGQFRGLPINKRLDIIEGFAASLGALHPRFFVQSMDPQVLQAVTSAVEMPTLPVPPNPREPRGFALIGLVVRICDHIRDTRPGVEKAVVVCDHGILMPGTGVHLPIAPDVIYQNTLYFVDSADEVGIQVADFAAFLLNRHQQILARGEPTDLEKSLLYATKSIAPLFEGVEPHLMTGPINPRYHHRYVQRLPEDS